MNDAPPALRERYADRHWGVAWAFVPDKIVYRLESPTGEASFLKLQPLGQQITLAAEAERLRWAAPYASVPRVLDAGIEDGTEWLLTSGLPGYNATSKELQADPAAVVAALGRGLRRFDGALPVFDCPFDSRLNSLLPVVQKRAAGGLIDHDRDFHPEHEGLSVAQAVATLINERPASEDLVVCHGDYCFPNALIEDGEVTGYLDLGELGVADRWWDIAVGSWSTTWNIGPGYEELFMQSYGIERDEARLRYYRLLYDLVS